MESPVIGVDQVVPLLLNLHDGRQLAVVATFRNVVVNRGGVVAMEDDGQVLAKNQVPLPLLRHFVRDRRVEIKMVTESNVNKFVAGAVDGN